MATNRPPSPAAAGGRVGGCARPGPPTDPAPVPFAAALAAELAGRRRAVLAAAVLTTLGLGGVLAGPASTSASGAAPPLPPPAAAGPAAPPAPPQPLTPERHFAVLAERAAASCPGLPAGVLYGISETETNHGRDPAVSSAGAVGPMQFLPSTWRAYATDGDGDGRLDIRNPADAVHTAARHLCANGGADPARLRHAILNYNHSHGYVAEVLRAAEAYVRAQ